MEPSIWINTTPQWVWQAITEPVHLAKWYTEGSEWEIPSLTPGGIISFHAKANDGSETGALEGTIMVVEPLRQFAFRWEPGGPEPRPNPLITSYLLEEEDSGTRLTLRMIEESDETLTADEKNAEACETALKNLKAHLEGTRRPYWSQELERKS